MNYWKEWKEIIASLRKYIYYIQQRVDKQLKIRLISKMLFVAEQDINKAISSKELLTKMGHKRAWWPSSKAPICKIGIRGCKSHPGLKKNLPWWWNGIHERLKIFWRSLRVGSNPTRGTANNSGISSINKKTSVLTEL